MNTTGIFQCIKCNLIFTASPHSGWHLECPNLCRKEIKYDKHQPYYSLHKYFKWLDYEVLFGKGNKNGKQSKTRKKNARMEKR